MWDEEQLMEQVEAYAEDRLTGPDRAAFEKRMASDPHIADHVRNYRLTRRALTDVLREQSVRTVIERAEATHRQGSDRNTTFHWAAAASVALLLSVGAWYLLGSSSSLPSLAERYAVHESPLPVLMSVPLDHRSALDRSMQLFGEDHFDQALAELETLPASDTVSFYAGLCALELGQDPSARFRPVIDDATSGYRSKALYHLMLWQLKQEHRAEAIDLLDEQLLIRMHPYRQQLEALAADKALRH